MIIGGLTKVEYIKTLGLSEKQIAHKKEVLIEKHSLRACKGLSSSCAKEGIEFCKSRLFFIQFQDCLALCGIYTASEKKDRIGDGISIRHLAYDYVFYNSENGFYKITGCTSPQFKGDICNCSSPSVYHKNNTSEIYTLLQYNETYTPELFQNVLIKHNTRTYISHGQSTYDITVFHNSNEVFSISSVTMYAELPMEPYYVVISKEINHKSYRISAELINVISRERIPLHEHGGYSFSYSFQSKLPEVVIHASNPNMRTSDEKNISFYISKNDTLAYKEIMKCSDYFRTTAIQNLFSDDPSINIRIDIPLNAPEDVISFICGVIHKSNSVYPVIYECPVHDVVETLGGYSKTLPPHSIDEISASNIISIIKNKFPEIENWQIILLLAERYGEYAVQDKYSKFWDYFHGENLRCEYLPVSMESIIGEKINGSYVKRLHSTTVNAKWISEYKLFLLIFKYYSSAMFHYTDNWLGYQHLDIYIQSINVGIEYQGEQHYKPNEYFGGDIAFADRQYLDNYKRQLCFEQNITLIEWPYTLPVTAGNLLCLFAAHGITLPAPDPNAQPPEQPESIPEEKIALSIRQYSIDGKLLQCYNSYQEAASICGISVQSICKAALGYSQTAGGYQWRREITGTEESDIEPLHTSEVSNIAKPICQLSMDGKVIAEFDSINKAEKATGINRKSIRSALSGTQKQAGGYHWEYLSNTINAERGNL